MIISLICDILLSIVFASIILILFFFIHVVPNEQNILYNNLNYLIDTTFKDLYIKDIINSNVLSNIIKNNKQYLNTNYTKQIDKAILDNNKKIINLAKIVLGSFIVGLLGITCILSYMYNINIKNIIIHNLYLSTSILIIDYIFFEIFVKNYISIDRKSIVKKLLNH
uniref:Uncharacterized protein n=1 Tax=viral metagenome TaxID=1070528 RepID=A0A6C0H767_9ZZZZ